MKRTKKMLVGFLACLSVVFSSLGLVGCGETGNDSSNEGGLPTVWTIDTVYAKAQELGYTGTLEEFLETVKGKDGVDGATGAQGEKGEKGDTGAQGEKGEKGDTGAQGEDGEDGVGIKNIYINTDGELIVELTVGEPKSLGKVVGEKGEKGDTGATGAQGEKGEKGDTGATGAQGEKGEKGDTGATGAQGEKGEDGVGIKNAYINEDGELIVEFTEGEPKNLGKIVGEKGEKGDQGEQGIQGLQGVGIANVEFDDDGNLLITFTDGSTQTVAMPEKEEHIHAFGEWVNFTADSVSCDEGLFYHVCVECNVIEWRKGTYADHEFGTDYGSDKEIHWVTCKNCGEKKESDHTIDNSGYCTVCDQLVGTTVGILYQVSTDRTYAEAIGYEGTATRIIIADSYNNLPVKSIAENAFKDNENITSVVISDGISIIKNYAFYNCTGLTSVVIPDSVTSIEGSAFKGCTGLTSVTIGNSVTSIGDYAFYNTGYYNTESNWADGVLYIGNYLIEGKDTLVGAYEIKQGTLGIASYAFRGCTGLTSVTIGNSVTSIGGGAFYDCTSLTSITFNGTVKQWYNIDKGDEWNDNVPATRFVCSDGEVWDGFTPFY